MSGSTEVAGLFQFLQIIITILIVICQSYAFYTDGKWNKLVKSKGERLVCPFIVHQVDPAAYNHKVRDLLNISMLPWSGGKLDTSRQTSVDSKTYRSNIYRESAAEKTSMALTIAEFLVLSAHLLAACWSSDYEYRTKWTAVVQGVTVFTSGFSSILMAISAYHFNQGFELLAAKFKICTHLLTCSIEPDDFESILLNEEFNSLKNEKVGKLFKDKMDSFAVCQQFGLKLTCTTLAGVKILLAFGIICNAMDLTTLYDDEDVDEEERARRENYFNGKGLNVKNSNTRQILESMESEDAPRSEASQIAEA